MQTASSNIDVKITDLALVVLCGGNAPAVLSADFLRHRNVVPSNMEVVESACVSTPVYSRVVYQGMLAITSDEERITVQEKLADHAEPTIAQAPEIATRLLAQFPNVQCKAVGINPAALVQHIDEASFTKLFREGPWLSVEGALPECTARFSFRLPDRKLNIEFAGKMQRTHDRAGTAATGLVMSGNFHHDISSQLETNRIAKDIIASEWSSEVGEFAKLAHTWASQLLSS